ncbi:MAG: DUF1853 family protein [Pseudomonadota bacterium]|nr:DUF1853 family protein [Pseudomonadota bacterium]
MPDLADTYQAHFARRWGQLRQPHVRALAWLLDAPGLLDAADPHWQGKVAAPTIITPALCDWLARLDADPAALDAALGAKLYTRLGLYAEKLMAFYYQQHGQLVAHGLQVRASRNDTVGEFDFLLDAGPDGVEHIELATKFYLLEGDAATRFDTFVGPNLADSLGAKMRKIVGKQLALGVHPAAQALLPRPVLRAHALVKGWLFYPAGSGAAMDGIAPLHCRGFWCALAEVGSLTADHWVVLPRLQWLAPYRGESVGQAMSREALQAALGRAFETGNAPVLVAAVRECDGVLLETARGFVVPDDWRVRAAQRQAALA